MRHTQRYIEDLIKKCLFWRAKIIALFFSGHKLCFAQQDGDDIVIAKYKMIHSHILDEDRLLFVHLPRRYEDTQLAYPVLYLYIWTSITVLRTRPLSRRSLVEPPVIHVNVANTDRYRDLLPVPTRGRSEGGGTYNLLRFPEEKLIPHIPSALPPARQPDAHHCLPHRLCYGGQDYQSPQAKLCPR